MSDFAPDCLREIVAAKRADLERRMADASLEAIRRRAIDAPPPRDFFAALSSAASPPAIVAEIKGKSPSGGILRTDFSPSAAAKQYCDNGAACLSVLTDAPFFGGDDSHLQQARAACPLPVLRKDFMLDEWQIYESRALGADAILLIAAILPPPTMQAMAALASRLGMAALAEAHSEKEMHACLATPAAMVGINNRNLSTLQTSLQTGLELLPKVKKAGRLAVAESGIGSPADIAKLQSAGANAFLIGESFMRADNPGDALRKMRGG